MTFRVQDAHRWLAQYRARASKDLLDEFIRALKTDLVEPRLTAYRIICDAVAAYKSSGELAARGEIRLHYLQACERRTKLQNELTFLVSALRRAKLHRQDYFTPERRNPIDLGIHVLSHALRCPGVVLLKGAGSMSRDEVRALQFTQDTYTEIKAELARELLDRFNGLFPAPDEANATPSAAAALRDTLYRKVLATTPLTGEERILLDTLFTRV